MQEHGKAEDLLLKTHTERVREKKLVENLLRSIKRLRHGSATEKTTQFCFLQEEALESGDTGCATVYQMEVLKLVQEARAGRV